jgi:hypothetical protein
MTNAKSIKKSAANSSASQLPVTHSKTINSIQRHTPYIANRTFIDEVALSLPVDGELPGDTVNLVSADGELKWRGQNRMEIDGQVVAGCTARVRTINRNNLTVVSSIKFLQGHNVAGTEALRPLVKKVLARIIERVEHLHDLNWKLPKPGDVSLDEVALVRHVRLPAGLSVSKVIDEYQRRGVANGMTTLHHEPGETYTFSSNKREHSITVYWKRKELEDRPGPSARHPRFDQLKQHVDGCLRIELRVRKSLLVDLDLTKVSSWADKQIADCVMSVVLQNRAPFMWMKPLTSTSNNEDSELPRALSRAFALAQAGENLKTHYAESSLRRLRRNANAHGIDLMGSGKHSDISFDLRTCDWVTTADKKLQGIAGFNHYFPDD